MKLESHIVRGTERKSRKLLPKEAGQTQRNHRRHGAAESSKLPDIANPRTHRKAIGATEPLHPPDSLGPQEPTEPLEPPEPPEPPEPLGPPPSHRSPWNPETPETPGTPKPPEPSRPACIDPSCPIMSRPAAALTRRRAGPLAARTHLSLTVISGQSVGIDWPGAGAAAPTAANEPGG